MGDWPEIKLLWADGYETFLVDRLSEKIRILVLALNSHL